MVDREHIIVTGGAGFIGKNYIKHLNSKGIKDIFPCDYGFPNIWKYTALILKDDLFGVLDRKEDNISCVVHLGATTDTQATKEECMKNNYEFTVKLIQKCNELDIPIIYASSAAVYGNGDGPLNAYGESKLKVDDWVRENGMKAVGLRFFNVYGDRYEHHKGDMKSFISRIKDDDYNKLFIGTEDHRRDFINVTDVCKVIDYFRENYSDSMNGIYDVGTGTNISFKELFEGFGVEYELIKTPQNLKGRLQQNTVADLTALRNVGYSEPFRSVKEIW